MSGLKAHLSSDETLIWEGAPSGKAPNQKPHIILRIFSWIMLVCFAVFLLIGLANLDEMDGAFNIWIGFLVLTGGAWLFLGIFMPRFIRRSHARTRYGVTEHQAIILLGGRKLQRFEIPEDETFKHVEKAGLQTIYFHFPLPVNQRVNGQLIRVTPPANGFLALNAADMQAAEIALNSVRGKTRP